MDPAYSTSERYPIVEAFLAESCQSATGSCLDVHPADLHAFERACHGHREGALVGYAPDPRAGFERREKQRPAATAKIGHLELEVARLDADLEARDHLAATERPRIAGSCCWTLRDAWWAARLGGG